MIDFTYSTDWRISDEKEYIDWISRLVNSEDYILGELTYQFCSDEELLEININHLNHNYYTDIITFDYVQGKVIFGNIFISVDRVRDNANEYGVEPNEEMKRVMAHGVLHLLGYKDGNDEESRIMRGKEDNAIKMFHVEQ